MKHLLSIESLSADELRQIVALGAKLKATRGERRYRPLDGQAWAMIFNKSSTRTRVSFEVGIRELGGYVMTLTGGDLQLGRGEPIKDTARAMGRMVAGCVIRTYAQQDVVDFADYGMVPTINALTDDEHPCQVLADLLTMQELCGGWDGKKVVFLGDGDNNMSRSWMWASERLGFELVIAAPQGYQPPADYLARLHGGTVRCEADPSAAVQGADVLYTDVWVSMGQEEEGARRVDDLQAYQINDALVAQANPGALVMHCLPAYREKEISEAVLEAHADTIFQEAENRLHAQKAVLALLADPAL
ncbi:ornithine carbamoyltransferase [soil metagenome]